MATTRIQFSTCSDEVGSHDSLLPHDLQPWQTVYSYVRGWTQDGTWERMLGALSEAEERGMVATKDAAA